VSAAQHESAAAADSNGLPIGCSLQCRVYTWVVDSVLVGNCDLEMEVIVTSEISGQLWNCCVWDPLTGTALRSFEGGISCSRTLTTISSDYLISAQKGEPIIQVAF